MFDKANMMSYLCPTLRRVMMSAVALNTSWSFLKAFGRLDPRGLKHVSLPSGIEMLFVDIRSETAAQNVFNIDQAPLAFAFHLAGCGTGTMTRSPSKKEQVDVCPGKAVLSFNPESQCLTRMNARQTFKVLNLYIAPQTLRGLLQEDVSQVPQRLGRVLENRDQAPFNLALDISPAARMILDQIYNCDYQGAFYNRYLEAKSMELILRLLWETAKSGVSGLTGHTLSDQDRAKICHARDILIREADAPPALKTLARKAGLNDTKLKRGFRQVYGTTVFGYLRQYRMVRAARLLSAGQMNVDETAYTLGFHDTAHFIRQFRQHYGTTPGTYLKQARSTGPVLPEENPLLSCPGGDG